MIFNTMYFPKNNPPTEKTTRVTAIIDWSGSGSLPSSVTLILMRDGGVYDMSEVNASSGWQKTWLALPEAVWSILPTHVNGYNVSQETEISGSDMTCIIVYEPETA